MREIVFRGRRADNGEWVKGNLVVWNDKSTSIDDCGDKDSPFYAVDPKTVGQYTGVKDVNGKRIFEGDICKGYNPIHSSRKIYQVAFADGWFGMFDENGTSWSPSWIEELEVLGNIYDNQELLKEDKE